MILTGFAQHIAELGFTVIYLPPPWIDRSTWENGDDYGGGEGYFWSDFDLNSFYGTEEELRTLVEQCHQVGIKVIVDIVTNHRDYKRMTRDIWDYPGESWRACPQKQSRAKIFLAGDADIDHSCFRVQSCFIHNLNRLVVECNVDGFRWDQIYGMDPDLFNQWITNLQKAEIISIGEYWPRLEKDIRCGPLEDFDPLVERYGVDPIDRVIGWASDTSSHVLDYRFKEMVQRHDVQYLDYGLNTVNVEWIRKSMVTFVENHDTGMSPLCRVGRMGQMRWPCSEQHKPFAYTFMLCGPGVPMVYWPDLFDFGHYHLIAQLLRIRKNYGVAADCKWCASSRGPNRLSGTILDSDDHPIFELGFGELASSNLERKNILDSASLIRIATF
ncbi:alpha-amylase family glycosyl hydrolase [Azoarcus sp. PA01]|nr:alpha-amylase family glycosyl hydrolase [Azoarcus sp. PA01]KAI5913733.1 alpha-amylase family glycosyl hydrolase [Azoarcus sp. PA01]